MGLGPRVENVWQYLRQSWHFNRLLEAYGDIINVACNAWRKLIAQPATNTPIGTRQSPLIGQR